MGKKLFKLLRRVK